jgi:cytochrome c biogenesis protein CcmG/thiol:disulfide interchange protein DsbE
MSRDVNNRKKPDQPGLPKVLVYLSAALAVLLIIVGVWALWRAYLGSPPNDPAFADRYSTPVAQVQAAVDFSLQTPDGRTLQLSDYRGQVVLLNTWATWCPPCRDEMPDLEAYYRKRQADGFVVLAVNSQESAETVAAFLEKNDFTFPVLLDPDGVVMKHYGIRGLPTSFFIDRDGTVRGVWSGQLSPERLCEIVDPLL